MRVLLGLAALVAGANAQLTTTLSIGTTQAGTSAATPVTGSVGSTAIRVTTVPGGVDVGTPAGVGSGQLPSSPNFFLTVATAVNSILFTFNTNQYVAQVAYRFGGFNAPIGAYTCDACSTGCDTTLGYKNQNTFTCANLGRTFTLTNLYQQTKTDFGTSGLGVLMWDVNNTKLTYVFQVTRTAAATTGDPQIVGMQGQDFQVHGMPDEIFNVVSYPTLQVNARFTYLESGSCHDNFTACFAHPGTYISEEGFRVGRDKIRVVAGSFKKGLTVSVNGKKVHDHINLKSGAVQVVNHRRVIVHTDIMKITVSNSDHFLNQELELIDDKLVSLGSVRKVLKDNERFHPEVPLHGLQGQTWRNVEYPSGLEYEGSIMDYHVVDGNLFGTDFVFNQFSS